MDAAKNCAVQQCPRKGRGGGNKECREKGYSTKNLERGAGIRTQMTLTDLCLHLIEHVVITEASAISKLINNFRLIWQA